MHYTPVRHEEHPKSILAPTWVSMQEVQLYLLTKSYILVDIIVTIMLPPPTIFAIGQ